MSKRLLGVLALLSALVLAGCFGPEGEEECIGAECDNATLNLNNDPESEPGAVEEEEEAAQDSPFYWLDFEPGGVAEAEPSDPGFLDPAVDFEQVEEIIPDNLTPAQLAKIEVLRGAIEHGLDLGQLRYLETVSLALADAGIMQDYEGAVIDGFADLKAEVEACPFAKYYDNGFEATGVNCDYLVDMAKFEVYSQLTKTLDSNPLPAIFQEAAVKEECDFWYEQGAMSGIEEQRVAVRTDIKQKQLCNKKPTPVESSYEKGIIVGRQKMAEMVNKWLIAKGHKGDYPVMSDPIDVCNADKSMLLPAKQSANKDLADLIIKQPLCLNYEPPTLEGKLQYAQAMIDYEKGLKQGIEAEFAMAAVMVFRVIPCNVSDPLVIDLDGNGIELLPVARGVDFDLYATGSRQAVGWVGPNDGLLVHDRNGNGRIEDGSELFGNLEEGFRDGYDQLSRLDADGNGRVDAADPLFADLAIWKDANSDGVTQDGELASLASVGIVSVALEARNGTLESAGQRIARVAEVKTVNGRMLSGDAYLTSAPYARLACRD